MKRAFILMLGLGFAGVAQAAAACEWASLGQRRATAERIVEGRVTSVRIARVWLGDWRVHVDRVATVQPLATVKGHPQPAPFEYRFSTYVYEDERCSDRPDRAVEPGETGYFLWEGSTRPTLVLTAGEYLQPELDD